jgi:hypothetical protein
MCVRSDIADDSSDAHRAQITALGTLDEPLVRVRSQRLEARESPVFFRSKQRSLDERVCELRGFGGHFAQHRARRVVVERAAKRAARGERRALALGQRAARPVDGASKVLVPRPLPR